MKNFSLALLTDLYQLTMALCYWKEKVHEKKASFTYFFRTSPFKGEYALSAGLTTLIEFIEELRFNEDDISYLKTLKDPAGHPLFPQDFLLYLKEFRFHLDIDAVEEGSVVFPQEPLIRVSGSLLEGQLLETPLLNIMNFQTLIATKASRICKAAEGDEVVEFGVRRAQGMNGALLASRAAFIGGCKSTSHLLAGKHFGIPVRGTQAHSWIMAFDSEKEAFSAFARHMGSNAFFLIDTYDSIQGTKNAIEIAKKEKIDLKGVRLDSGDLAKLSKEVRNLLDRAGFTKTQIMASNELDEHIIKDLKLQGAKIDVWGVGTALVTAKDQPALDGVYKLSMVEDHPGHFSYKMKTTNDLGKATIPGLLNIYRYYEGQHPFQDVIFDEIRSSLPHEARDLRLMDKKISIPSSHYKKLLLPIFRAGKKVYEVPSLSRVQEKARKDLESFDSAVLRFLNPTPYSVALSEDLYQKRVSLLEKYKKFAG